jgi:protein-tyrosine phosphatase
MQDSLGFVCDNIYISSLQVACDEEFLLSKNINFIINLSGIKFETNLPVIHIFIADKDVTFDLLDTYIDAFTGARRYIKSCIDNNLNVLVNCRAGVNRSATAIAFYLLSSGLSYNQVIYILLTANNARNVPVLTNPSFRYLIKTYASLIHYQKKKY